MLDPHLLMSPAGQVTEVAVTKTVNETVERKDIDLEIELEKRTEKETRTKIKSPLTSTAPRIGLTVTEVALLTTLIESAIEVVSVATAEDMTPPSLPEKQAEIGKTENVEINTENKAKSKMLSQNQKNLHQPHLLRNPKYP
jgi:hypothetical protein